MGNQLKNITDYRLSPVAVEDSLFVTCDRGRNIRMNMTLYILIINVIAFVVYGMDKQKAVKKEWRISEDTLIGLALIGGSVGALLGMRCFHHKTLKKKFSVGVPLILILQIGAIIYFCLIGN